MIFESVDLNCFKVIFVKSKLSPVFCPVKRTVQNVGFDKSAEIGHSMTFQSVKPAFSFWFELG